MENPSLLVMFPTLHAQFPEGKIVNAASFRSNEAIRRHGCAVVFLIDRMISEFDNLDLVKVVVQKAAERHQHLKAMGMRGSNFMVRLQILYICNACYFNTSTYVFTRINVQHSIVFALQFVPNRIFTTHLSLSCSDIYMIYGYERKP